MKRILVVDDEPGVVALLTDILELDGYAVDTAADGAEALFLITSRHYDAILSDVMMPVIDGFGLYRELLAQHPILVTRIAFLAARFDAADQLRGLNVPVLEKPATVDQVRRVVARLIEASA